MTKQSATAQNKNGKGEWENVGGFDDEFIPVMKDGESFEGVFMGVVEKTMEDEKREFATFIIEGHAKTQIIGGSDLINKVRNVPKETVLRVTFDGMESFTPKGTKKKRKVKRYSVQKFVQK